eukprot:352735-Chlamydomonas_euryale.AAC.4
MAAHCRLLGAHCGSQFHRTAHARPGKMKVMLTPCMYSPQCADLPAPSAASRTQQIVPLIAPPPPGCFKAQWPRCANDSSVVREHYAAFPCTAPCENISLQASPRGNFDGVQKNS